MFRRILQIVSTVGLVVAAGVLVARAAEPAVRPVLYPPPPTTVAPPTTVTLPPITTTTSTTIAPVAAVDEFGDPVPTTVPGSATTTTQSTTTTAVPIDEEAVLSATYAWGRSATAEMLQTLLGVTADGWYGPATRAAHLAELQARGMGAGGVPPVPTTTTTTSTVPPTTAPPETTTTTTAIPAVSIPSTFGGLGAELVAQLLGQPCIADGDLSDCPPEVGALISGLVD